MTALHAALVQVGATVVGGLLVWAAAAAYCAHRRRTHRGQGRQLAAEVEDYLRERTR